MRLIYNDSHDLVKVGDIVTLRDGEQARVEFFREPHKPSSSGKVSVKIFTDKTNYTAEYYVGVIGARWVDREDRQAHAS